MADLVTIELEGFEEAIQKLDHLIEKSANTRPLMGKLGELMIESVGKNFEAQGRPNKWAPHKDSTISGYSGNAISRARKTKAWAKAKERGKAGIENRYVKKYVGGSRILVQSGDLRKSIVMGEVTDSSVSVGSAEKYARVHQFGHTFGPMSAKNAKALMIPTKGGAIFRKSVGSRTVPARPFLVIPEQDKPIYIEAINSYLEGSVE